MEWLIPYKVDDDQPLPGPVAAQDAESPNPAERKPSAQAGPLAWLCSVLAAVKNGFLPAN